jgi:hypothetical protein
MWLNQLFKHYLSRRVPRRCAQTARPRLRPLVVQLEDRTVPSTFTAVSVGDLIADINAANAAGGANTIVLVAGTTFTLTAVNNTADGPTGLPVIAANDSLTIHGNGDTIARGTSSATPAFRLFDVAAGASLALDDLMLQGGLASGYGVRAQGGAVYNLGALNLQNVTVQNNTAQGFDGIDGSWAPSGGDAAGGGVYSAGELTMTACTIQNNAAIGGHGGAGASTSGGAPGEGYVVPNGAGGNGFGGGLYVAGGTVTLHTTSISGNNATGGAGGQGLKHAASGGKGHGVGGGIYIDDSPASVGLDAFTASNVKHNHASTSDANIRGSYDVVV